MAVWLRRSNPAFNSFSPDVRVYHARPDSSARKPPKGQQERGGVQVVRHLEVYRSAHQTYKYYSPSLLSSPTNSRQDRSEVINSGIRESGSVILKTMNWESAHEWNVWLGAVTLAIKTILDNAVD
ncbi:hypothetical protein OUZ56_016487 [Daphnia magna]|uniref:Uncharacterized protein n=1 Tax=Daphnia magna TaxID=35525 RepID=A0ABR0AQP2_9CRUS|nr:hypothetical protein OUZ56_016487 [Daphnia magna]